MTAIYNLRVRRNVVGSGFPFDRVYLCRHGEHECFKQLFRYALILPVDDTLKTMLIRNAVPEEYTNLPFARDDNQGTRELTSAEWAELLNNGNWVMAVPILTRFIRKAIPRYLTAAEWYRDRYKRTGRRKRKKLPSKPSPFPGMTYLQTPEKDIRPICVMCSRFILHQNGECSPGQKVCFEDGNLTVGVTDYFQEGLDAQQPSSNINEPEVEEMIEHGDVP